MISAKAYESLLAYLKEEAALGQIAQLLHWDQEAMMPPKGAEQRAEQAAALMGVIHARRTDPRIADWLDAIDPQALDEAGRWNLYWTRRRHQRATSIPVELAIESARTRTLAHEIWVDARAKRSFKDFAPVLEQIIALTRARAECLQGEGQSLYDALLEEYEPGATEAGISAMFGRLRTRLARLAERIAENSHEAPPLETPQLQGRFPPEAQLKLSREIAAALGYDFQAGRLDLVVHPFMSGTSGDVRITARMSEEDPLYCLLAVIHETGHALYEQGLDPGLAWQPAGASVSMGVHESQSRLFENQIGRSAAFAEYLLPLMQASFGEIGVATAQDLYSAINHVEPGFLRTEADEVHYNLHILLRFDLERALLTGDLPVADLEDAWNARFAADFGREVPHAGLGVLQDVHWSAGLIGYFPTYTLGNIHAAALWAALRRDIPEVDALIRAGEFVPLLSWLREKVHRPGSRGLPAEIIADACGEPVTEGPLLDYLDEKFGLDTKFGASHPA